MSESELSESLQSRGEKSVLDEKVYGVMISEIDSISRASHMYNPANGIADIEKLKLPQKKDFDNQS